MDAAHQTQLWAERYERTLGDLLGIQCEVARAITHEILQVLTLDRTARAIWLAGSAIANFA